MPYVEYCLRIDREVLEVIDEIAAKHDVRRDIVVERCLRAFFTMERGLFRDLLLGKIDINGIVQLFR